MIDQQRPIEPPPSIDDILTNQGRIGRVDFSHRLAPAPQRRPAPESDGSRAVAADESAANADAAAATAEEAAAIAAAIETPTQPEEPVQAVPDAEVEVGTDDPEDDGDDEYDGDEAATDASEEPEPVAAEPADLPRRQPTPQVSNLLSLVPAEDAPTVTEDIDEVVDSVIARIREAQHATLVHLEAVEAEAALRCEMLTAQAELDAELIRLHARREAHAIITAARQRSGVAQPARTEDHRRRLDQLSDAAMRLVEELEALGVDLDSPEHPFRR